MKNRIDMNEGYQKIMKISTSEELSILLREIIEVKAEVKELHILENGCCDIEGDVEISEFSNLEKIVFKRGSLKNGKLLRICNNTNLKSIVFNSNTDISELYTCRNVKRLVIESMVY